MKIGGGVRLIKPAKLYMCMQTHYKHNEDGRTAPGVCGHGSVPLSHGGERRYENWITHNYTEIKCGFKARFSKLYNAISFHIDKIWFYHLPFTLKGLRASYQVFYYMYNIEDPRYNDGVYYQIFCCKIEFAVIKKLDRTHLKHQ